LSSSATARRADRRALRAETARGRRLRPARFDDLGLKRALSDRLLPSLVAAMAFLAALALAGFVAANTLGIRWQAGAGSSLTIQVPQPGARSGPDANAAADPGTPNRRDAVVALLRATQGVTAVHPLTEGELSDLLRPWLGNQGEAITVPLPAVIRVSLAPGGSDLAALKGRLDAAAPGTLLEDQNAWASRLAALAHSLQASTGLALIVVGVVAVAVVAVATRTGLVARRGAIEIVHGLGATDSYIAGRFAARATKLALIGGAIGAIAALPVLLELAALAAPFAGGPAPSMIDAAPRLVDWFDALPATLCIALPCLPVAAAGIGWLTAQITVRRWLKRLA
jgi:cell division transport system permease protein